MHTSWLYYVLLLLQISAKTWSKINVALHAQVSPNSGKIVGSVITTDGLAASFRQRSDIGEVVVFYPFAYQGFYQNKWDLLVIEGWFPSIQTFIQLSRNHNPSMVVLFFCLDPSFPGMHVVKQLDVNAYMTNSKMLQEELTEVAPTIFLMLAANPAIMRPYLNVTRTWGAVYVGAGAGMVTYKRHLLGMLMSVATSARGLRLHGANWNEVPDLAQHWHGPLARDGLAEAYASAYVVMASTIDSQSQYGMVNNRIFEALSCGAVVVSDYSDALYQLAGDMILYVRNPEDALAHLDHVVRNSSYATRLREQARNFVLEKHTWSHRVVEILDLYHSVKSMKSHSSPLATMSNHIPRSHEDPVSDSCMVRPSTARSAQGLPRGNMLSLLWIVEEEIEFHPDYTMILENGKVMEFVQNAYDVSKMKASVWNRMISAMIDANAGGESIGEEALKSLSWLSEFDVIVGVGRLLGDLDRSLRDTPSLHLANRDTPSLKLASKDRVQKRAFYMLGCDAHAPGQSSSSSSSLKDALYGIGGDKFHYHDRYDLVLYRDSYDLGIMDAVGFRTAALRLQHAFGISKTIAESISNPDVNLSDNGNAGLSASHEDIEPYGLLVCFIDHRELCATDLSNFLNDFRYKPYRILLIGGAWDEWMGSLGLILRQHSSEHNPPSTQSQQVSTSEILEGVESSDDPEVSALSRVSHIKDGRVGNGVDLVMYAHTMWQSVPEISGDESSGIKTGTSNILWPTVVGAQTQTKFHLPRYNHRIISVLNDDASGWSNEYVMSTMRDSVDRLHGLASAQSAVTAFQVWDGDFQDFSEVADELRTRPGGVGHSGIDVDVGKLRVKPSEPAALSGSHSKNNYRKGVGAVGQMYTASVALAIQFDSFVPGRDGEVCVEARNETILCFTTPLSFLIANIDYGTESPEWTCLPGEQAKQISLTLQFHLYGIMFLDRLHSTSVNVVVSCPSSTAAPTEDTRQVLTEATTTALLRRNDAFDIMVE